MAILLFYVDRDLLPIQVPAEVVETHPDNTLTFKLLDSEFRRERLGFSPSAYVEKQAAPVGQINLPDRFYWAKRIPIED